ncbi:hypothetical protein [Sphingobium olei]|uniref:Energy transducer TonB n=1 Tax=Sphingobium olei TaxID=420955 RepID=A0ABW3P7P0_9SPHN|nr:hypothetical protein [Sphingobium sp.]
MTDPEVDPDRPPTRRMERAAIFTVCVVIAIIICVFVGLNLWHGQELKQDQATGDNRATEHTGTKLD